MSSRLQLLNLFSISDSSLLFSDLPLALIREGETEPFAEILTTGTNSRLIFNGTPSANAIKVIVD